VSVPRIITSRTFVYGKVLRLLGELAAHLAAASR
jgi:hypothetical protein